jgi:hypothetical protein
VTSLPSDSEGYDLILAFVLQSLLFFFLDLRSELICLPWPPTASRSRNGSILTWFRKVYDSLKAGGRFVLEKQGWKGYREGATKGGASFRVLYRVGEKALY